MRSSLSRLAAANRWRDQYNPLRGLTIELATQLLEAYQRGEMANLQWTYYFIEGTDPDLFALVERRTSALLEMNWDIHLTEVIDNTDYGAPITDHLTRFTEATLAAEQAAALREAYQNIENLYEAIEHLAMATFRGFAHLEKHLAPDGTVQRLEILDQWNVVRDGLQGDWKYNPEAKPVSFRHLSEDQRLDPAQWIIREVKRHVNRIGLIKYVRSNLAQKDWDSYVEVYGLPGVTIIGPPNVPPEETASYEARAQQVADGVSGYLPNGSMVQFDNGPRLINPFGEYMRYLTEQLVLTGTGGVLTMLTASGTGTLAGSVHQKTFEQIARAEARKISEVFQKQLDTQVLEAAFPRQPHLAYFTLTPNETINISATVEDALKLRQAGYQLDAQQLSERTGYEVSVASRQ